MRSQLLKLAFGLLGLLPLVSSCKSEMNVIQRNPISGELPAPAPSATPTTTVTTTPTSTSTPSPTPIWTRCAAEGALCSFSGTRQVRYGANGTYAFKTATDSILCANSFFGDPLPGVVKACDYLGSASTPSPNPSAAPTGSVPTYTPSPLPTHQIPIDHADTTIGRAVTTMQPGSWLELKTMNLFMDVTPPYAGHPAWGAVGPKSVIIAWGGGTIAKGKLYVWGGGHADYGGNEVYALDLESLKWSRLTNPSAYVSTSCFNDCMTNDGTPISVHSYDGIEYIPSINRIWMGPGSRWFSGNGTDQSFFFNLDTQSWEVAPTITGGFLATALDPVTGYLLVERGGTLIAYDPITNQVIKKSAHNWGHGPVSGAFDPVRRLFVQPFSDGIAFTYELEQVDWKNPSSGIPWNKRQPTYRIVNDVQEPFSPPNVALQGFEYDSRRGIFVGWSGDRSVWTLDPATWLWSEIPNPEGSAPVNFRAPDSYITRGVFGRWRYLPEYDVFVGYNNPAEGVWLYRMP